MIKNGKLTATSMQNIRPGVQGVSCVIKGNGRVIPISDKITSAQLDGVADRAVETDVTNFTIQCQK